jgi:amino acid adenylation domain-containing protein
MMSEVRTPENSSAATVEFDCPLSHGQRALWFLNRLAPASAAFNIVFAARVVSRIDSSSLRRAFQSLLDRHAALRTIYFERDGEPRQQIHRGVSVHFNQTDASNWTDQALYDRLAAETRRPFDLEHGPVLRVNLFSRSETEHFFALTMHHIAIDGWSLWICLDEIRILYSAEMAGTKAALPPPVWQYPDYVRWQQQMIGGPEGEKLWAFWQEKLDGEIPILNLSTDRPRPAMQTFRGASHFFRLDEGLTRKLKSFAQGQRTTPFTVLLTAYLALLYRYTGQKEILVGSPSSGRQRRELEGIVGYCVNPIVLRGNFAGNPPFRDLLDRVRETVLDAFEQQAYPFSLLVDRLQPNRDTSRSPLFQAMFVLQKPQRLEQEGISSFILGDSKARVSLGELVLEPLPFPIQQEGQFDLTLNFVESGEAFLGSFDYNTDLFEAGTMARMELHLRRLLEGIAADPGRRVGDLPLLSEGERRQWLMEWNRREVFPQDGCLHELFEGQAERSADAVAVVCEGRQLSYRELNQRANQLAHYLLGLGVGPESLVGICVERSLEMIIAILGVLKAGGAYVPLDPAYPTERLVFMARDTQSTVVLAQEHLRGKLLGCEGQVVCLDSDWGSIAQKPDTNPRSGVSSEHLAYVIYTSGSTGTPKGTLVTHGNVTRLFAATQSWFQFAAHDVWTLFHSYAFDFSVWELWGALLYGGRLVVVPFEISRSPQAFYQLLCKERVTVLNQTPSAFRQLIGVEEAADKGEELFLRLVIFGGEALDVQSLRPWLLRRGDKQPELVNMYGITETTVHVTYRPITMVDVEVAQRSPIGVSIADLQVYLLDAHQNLVPVGVAGEMYVGGEGLARGYLNHPELSAERFLPNPFSDKPGARLYRTGDLARILPDGKLEFLGRIDHQVKIRGYRIELGEVEAVLGQHPEVREALVVVREDDPGDKRLVAYITVEQEQLDRAQLLSDLRGFVRAKLPEYMVPSTFMVLDAMPLTPNGKVDRRALPVPEHTSAEPAGKFEAARTATEELLAGIWSEVLGVKEVSIHDNFFDLGGHSLLATVLISRIRNAFHIELPLHVLFEAPTLTELAGQIETARWKIDWSRHVSAAPGGDREQGEL